MLSRISLLLVVAIAFGATASVEAGNNKSFQSIAKKFGGNGGQQNGNNGNNNKQGNPVARQIGRQLLNQYVFGVGPYGNRGPINGNCNNGPINPNCNNGRNNNCPQGIPPQGQPPATEDPMDIPTPMDAPLDPMGTPGEEAPVEVGTEGEGAELTEGQRVAAALGADLQAKLVKFAMTPAATATAGTPGKSLVATKPTLVSSKLVLATNQPARMVYAEIVNKGAVAYNGDRTLTIEHDAFPGELPPTILAKVKIPEIAAGQTFKFQKALPAGYALKTLRLRMTLSPGDGNAANDTISSKE